MLAMAENLPLKPQFPKAEANRERAAETRATIRRTLQQAADLQQLSFEAALAIKNADNPAKLAEAQARAKAVYDATKSWDISVDRVRIVRGKPMPGSLRHDPKPKAPKKPQPNTFTEE